MKKQYIATALLLFALVLPGCAKQNDVNNNEETSDVTFDIAAPEENIVSKFEASENSTYFLELDGSLHDITPYVVSSTNGVCTFKSSIVSDVFGFTRMDDKSNDTFLVYEKDDDRIQFEIGGPYIIVNGTNFPSTSNIEKIEDSDDLAVPLDFVFGLGYSSYNTSRNGDELYFIVGEPQDQVETTATTLEEIAEEQSESEVSNDESESLGTDESIDMSEAEEMEGTEVEEETTTP